MNCNKSRTSPLSEISQPFACVTGQATGTPAIVLLSPLPLHTHILLMGPRERSNSGESKLPTSCRRPPPCPPFPLPLCEGSHKHRLQEIPQGGRCTSPHLMEKKRGKGVQSREGGVKKSPWSQAPPGSSRKIPSSIHPPVSRKATDPWLAPSPHCLCAGKEGGDRQTDSLSVLAMHHG